MYIRIFKIKYLSRLSISKQSKLPLDLKWILNLVIIFTIFKLK